VRTRGVFPGNHFFNNILPVLEKNLNINIYSVLCRNLRKKRKFKNVKNLKIYKNINRFLNDKDLDTVYVCSPNGLHANHALKALQNNKNVICEKPLVTSLYNFKKLIKTAKKSKMKNSEKLVDMNINYQVSKLTLDHLGKLIETLDKQEERLYYQQVEAYTHTRTEKLLYEMTDFISKQYLKD
jgi:hypothetical protein